MKIDSSLAAVVTGGASGLGLATVKALRAAGAKVPFPARLGRAEEYASMALEVVRNGYMNGETVRLNGARRMQQR